MRIFNCTLDSAVQDALVTEVRFNVASARATGSEFICFETKESDKEKISAAVSKILQAMKKEGKIDFFAARTDFELNTAKAGYLLNKLANISEILTNENLLLIVKL